MIKEHKVSILINESSWMNDYISTLKNLISDLGATVSVYNNHCELTPGDINFILSYSKIIEKNYLDLNKHNLVVHASKLPLGKGMSPLTWQILEGKNQIPLTLFEAQEELDSGDIYLQEYLDFEGHELIDEMRKKLAQLTIEMCLKFLKDYPNIIKSAKKQSGTESRYNKRTSADSELDLNKNIIEQFNLLRVVDNERYPAFFEHLGCRYIIKIFKEKDD